jgi:hypothetical protein
MYVSSSGSPDRRIAVKMLGSLPDSRASDASFEERFDNEDR